MALVPDIAAYYEHAALSRNGAQDTSGHVPSENSEDNLDRIELIAIARQLEKDFAPVGYGINEMARYIVPQLWRANTGDEEVDATLNRYIEMEMMAERFDYTQRNDAPTLWRLMSKDAMVDGDVFKRLVKPKGEPRAFAQAIRADLIGSVKEPSESLLQQPQANSKKKSGGRLRDVGGAMIDSRGRVKKWRKYREDTSDPTGKRYVFERAIPGKSVMQLLDPSHSDQYRGVTPLHDSAKEFRDLRVIWDYVRQNMEHGASIAAVVHNDSGTAPVEPRHSNRGPMLGPNATTGQCTTCNSTPCRCAPSTKDVEGVKLIYLKAKEQMTQFRIDNPGASFLECSRHLLQIGAWSMKMPAGVLFDSSGLSGAPMRFEISKAGCSIEDQKRNVVRRLCAPWLRYKILEGIERGVLPYSAAQLSDLTKGKWAFAEGPTADEKYRTSSYITLLDKGAISLEDVCEHRGTTFDEVLGENAKAAHKIYKTAQDLWENSDKDLEVSWWIDQLGLRGPQGSMPHLTEPGGMEVFEPSGDEFN